MSEFFPIGGLIGEKWQQVSPIFGQAVTPEYDNFDHPGKRQDFEHGIIAWCPGLGEKFMITFHSEGPNSIHVEWGPSDPFHYDFWIIRTMWSAYLGVPASWGEQQTEIPNTYAQMGPTHGVWNERGPGLRADQCVGGMMHYHFIVEGCDNPGNASCNQGWSPYMINGFPVACDS